MKIFCLLLLSLTVAAAEPLSESATAGLLARVTAQRSGKTVRATFVEKRLLPMMNEPVVERGTIAFEPPDRFLRRTDDGSLSVSDGQTLWMYYPQFSQAEKYPLNSRRGPGELFAALTRIFQLQDLTRQFHVVAEQLPDGYRLRLQPRGGAVRRMLQSAQLDLDSSLRLRASLIESPGGDRLETAYSDETFLAPGAVDFSFQPPEGTKIVSPTD